MLLKLLIFYFLGEILGNSTNFLGNYLSVEDYKKLELCESSVCILDSERIASYASESKQSQPCSNMNDFACGTFFKPKKVNENEGFELELEKIYYQQLKEVLSDEIQEEDEKVVKVVKKYYQKCVDANYVKTKGQEEAFSLLSEFGKFPIFEKSWKTSDFKLEKVILTTILQKSRISLCEDSKEPLICLSIFGFGKNVRIKEEVVRKMFQEGFNLQESAIHEAFLDYQDYNIFNDNSNTQTTIENIDATLNITSRLNWEILIKSELDKRFSFHLEKENSEAIKKNVVRIQGNLKEILNVNNRRKLANIFMIEYLFTLSEIFLIDPISNEEFKHSDFWRTKERFEKCIEAISAHMVYPLRILHQRKFLENSYEDSFRKFLNLEMKINLEQHLESIKDWNDTMKEDFRIYIKEAVIFIGFPERLRSPDFFKTFYSNLNLTGEEGLFKMNQEMKKHSNQLYHDFKTISLENVSETELDLLRSFVLQNPKAKHHLWRYPQFGTNVILFQSTDILYPVYHPDRLHFLNSVYLYDQVYEIFISLLGSFSKKYSKEIDFSYTESTFVDNVLYRNHLRYIQDYGQEPNLPGFLMTNHQMSYMILFQSRCRKDYNGTGFVDYFSTNTTGFQETFNC